MRGGRQRKPVEQCREEQRHTDRKQLSELANSCNIRAGKLLPTEAAFQLSGSHRKEAE